MRKETNNTFTEGMNLDLNPLSTPNNLLTDCINGTFLTYNGDEFILQNDAGNNTITIQYPQATEFIDTYAYNNGDIVYTVIENVKTYYKNISGIQEDTNNLDVATSWEELPLGEVRLSPGFFPIGLKEFGGVLYIVSAKKPFLEAVAFVSGAEHTSNTAYYIDNAGVKTFYRCFVDNTDVDTTSIVNWEVTIVPELFVPIVTKTVDHVYYKITNNTKYYYRCKLANGDVILPTSTNQNWSYIGTENDFNNLYGLVEFGSYPSPEYAGRVGVIGTEVVYDNPTGTEASVKDNLYKVIPLNNEIFKSGCSIKFDADATFNQGFDILDPDGYISGYEKVGNEATYIPRFYKYKLYHLLQKGILDLTDDIWEKYIDFKGVSNLSNTISWFNDPTFEYFNPNKYKGLLAVSLEIEELEDFSMSSPPAISKSTSSPGYDIELNIISIPKGAIYTYYVYYELKYIHAATGIETTFSDTRGASQGTSKLTETLNIKRGTRVYYTIRPGIYVSGDEVTSDLPKQYLDKYTLVGSFIATSVYDVVKFSAITTNYSCAGGLKTFNELVLKNEAGDYLDANLMPTATAHVFLRGTETSDIAGSFTLGTFQVVGNQITVLNTSNNDYLDQEVENFIGISTIGSTDCAILTIVVETFTNDNDYQRFILDSTKVYIVQGGETIYKYGTYEGIGYKFNIQPDVDFDIHVEDPRYDTSILTGLKAGSDNIIKNSSDIIIGSPIDMGGTLSTYGVVPFELQTTLNMITLNFSTGIDKNNLRVYQHGKPLEIYELTTKQYFVNKNSNADIWVYLEEPGYQPIQKIISIASQTSFTFAMIAKVISKIEQATYEVADGEGGVITLEKRIIYVAWRPSTQFVGESVSIQYTSSTGSRTTNLVWEDLYNGEGVKQTAGFEQVIDYPYTEPAISSFTVLLNALTGTYDNITNNASYVVKDFNGEIVIFDKTITTDF